MSYVQGVLIGIMFFAFLYVSAEVQAVVISHQNEPYILDFIEASGQPFIIVDRTSTVECQRSQQVQIHYRL